jgi:hypothetical protein
LFTEITTMIIIAILVSLAGIVALCWLLFNLAVFALPFFAGIAVGTWAHETSAGIPGAIIVGAIAAAVTFGLFQLLLLVARPAWIKLLVVLAFVAPAAVAGYHATLGIVKLTMPSDTWQLAFAILGAVAVGITAFLRLTRMAPPGPAGQGVAGAS